MNIRRILAVPAVYRLFREFIGSDGARQQHADLFIRARNGDRVLDIGCGPGDILTFLPDVEYVGFDMSQDYIDAARKRFGSRGKFLCERVGKDVQAAQGLFDIALAHGVLHHLNDSEAMDLFDIAYRSLKPGGRLVTIDGCYVPGQARLARYLLSKDRGEFVRSQPQYEALARSAFSNIAVHVRHDFLREPYTHIIMECTR